MTYLTSWGCHPLWHSQLAVLHISSGSWVGYSLPNCLQMKFSHYHRPLTYTGQIHVHGHSLNSRQQKTPTRLAVQWEHLRLQKTRTLSFVVRSRLIANNRYVLVCALVRFISASSLTSPAILLCVQQSLLPLHCPFGQRPEYLLFPHMTQS